MTSLNYYDCIYLTLLLHTFNITIDHFADMKLWTCVSPSNHNITIVHLHFCTRCKTSVLVSILLYCFCYVFCHGHIYGSLVHFIKMLWYFTDYIFYQPRMILLTMQTLFDVLIFTIYKPDITIMYTLTYN